MQPADLQLSFTLDNSTEMLFFDDIRHAENPMEKLRRFGLQYHYFSLHQVHAFCGIFRLFKPKDREIAAILAEVMYEELGEGERKKIHSILLENFLTEIGLDCTTLPIGRDDVVAGVREYVDALYSAFWGNNQARALATYCFLENSALETYPALVTLLTECGVSKQNLEFFELHSSLEVEHAAAASQLASKLVVKFEDIAQFKDQYSVMNQVWKRFWKDIHTYATN